MREAILTFLTTRILFLVIALVMTLIIPYSGFFPYGEVAKAYHLPDIFTKLANFDGVHYLSIAKEGYHTYEQAYFPLYPLLIRYSGFIFGGNLLLSAIFISNLAFLGILWVVPKLLSTILGKKETFWFLLFLLAFPTAFFFSAVYTESIFLFLFLLSLYFFQNRKYLLAFVFAVVTGLTRVTGLFLAVIFFTVLLVNWMKDRKNYSFKELLLSIFCSLGSIVGFGLYSLYLFITTGDFLFFFHVQPSFGAHRSTNLIFLPQVLFRYIKIFITSDYNFQLLVSYLEFGIFLISFFLILFFLYWIFQKNRYKKEPILLGIGLYSFIVIILPTITGTLSSIPRYSLLSLSLFFPLAKIQNNIVKTILISISLILQIALFGFFLQGYFIS